MVYHFLTYSTPAHGKLGGRSVLGLSSAWVARRNKKGVEIEVRGQRKVCVRVLVVWQCLT
jgi:hypothetical protein